jgi:hypothetical protein
VKTPPAASTRLEVSRWYQCAVALFAILLIASAAIFYGASGKFDLKMALVCTAAVCTSSWAVHDAWRPRQGALHYAAGEWVLAQGEQESQGTLHVVLDLQHYLLVRFTPSGHPTASSQQLKIKAQWLHLQSSYGQDWLALRRALYAAPASPSPAAPPGTQPTAFTASAASSSAVNPT